MKVNIRWTGERMRWPKLRFDSKILSKIFESLQNYNIFFTFELFGTCLCLWSWLSAQKLGLIVRNSSEILPDSPETWEGRSDSGAICDHRLAPRNFSSVRPNFQMIFRSCLFFLLKRCYFFSFLFTAPELPRNRYGIALKLSWSGSNLWISG